MADQKIKPSTPRSNEQLAQAVRQPAMALPVVDARVTLRRTDATLTGDHALWAAIRNRTDAIGFDPYDRFINRVLCKVDDFNVDSDELRNRFKSPSLLELIWSYWNEQGMLVQTMNAICLRFQNRRGPLDRDPLANLEIDPLRPLNNIIWGFIQDEPYRLTIPRRAYEYDHHYGLRLQGKAVPELRSADSRSKFIEAFHNLLYRAGLFYREDADTTVIADGFPLLNSLREAHLLLAVGHRR